MPLDLTDPKDLQLIDAIVRRTIAAMRKDEAQIAPAGLSRQLTVDEFAVCIQRGEEFVRRKIRAQVIPKECVQGPPYLIHSRALAKFGVTPELAVARLAEHQDRLQAQTPAEAGQPSQG